MKSKKLFILFSLMLLTLIPTVVSANFSVLRFIPKEHFSTTVYDKSGFPYTENGIIDTESIEKSSYADGISSYEISENGNVILSVNLVDILSSENAVLFDENAPLNGYYSTRFTLSEKDNTEVFLTGLTPENLKKVQNALISAKIENSEFSMDDIDFIDTEKLYLEDDGDNDLCWAASTSNILHYTGWAKKGSSSFKNTDDIFDYFVNNFTDKGGEPFRGIEWFFNGSYYPQTVDNWAHVKNFGNSGAYLKKYSSADVSSYYYSKTISDYFCEKFSLLEKGYGLAIELGWLDYNGERYAGHSVTCWGYITDNDFSSGSREHFKAMIISDSDDYYSESSDRRSCPNTLAVLNMKPYDEYGYNSWLFEGYGYIGVFESCTFLMPYSDGVPYETDSSAKLNKISYPDLLLKNFNIYVNGELKDVYKKYYKGDTITVTTTIENQGNVDYKGNIKPRLTVLNSKTNQNIYNNTYTSNATVNRYSFGTLTKVHEIPSQNTGVYTLTASLNESKGVFEAYYYNNTKSHTFEIITKSADLSGGKLTANIDVFKNGKANVTFSYGTLKNISPTNTSIGKMYKSIYDGSAWSDYTEIYDLTNTAFFPASCFIPGEGKKIKFKFSYSPDSETIPLEYISPEYSLSYSKLNIEVSENNCFNTAETSFYDKGLLYDQKFEFRIKNTSSENLGNLNYDINVFAEKENEKSNIYSLKNQTLSYGATSKNITINSWDVDLTGIYEVYAEITGDFGSDRVLLGNLSVKEKPLFTVNTAEYSTSYDGMISISEAINYYQTYATANDIITIAPGITPVLEYPVYPGKNININGNGNELLISGYQHFQISTGITLTLSNVTLKVPDGKTGGGISVNKGTLILDNVTFDNCSRQSGSAINSINSHVTAKNCTIKNCTASTGCIVAVNQYSYFDALNCIFHENTANTHLIEIQYSYATFIYNTFTDNITGSGKGIIYNSYYMPVCAIGCIITNPLSDYDIKGHVQVYGCILESYYSDAVVDRNTKILSHENLFLCDGDENVIFTDDKYKMSSLIQNGVKVSNISGKVNYTADGETFIPTNAEARFNDSDYQKDKYGVSRVFVFGADASVFDKCEFAELTDEAYVVFSPYKKEVIFYEKGENSSNKIISLIKKDITLDEGTNYIYFEERSNNLNYKYMLWEKDNSLCPVTVSAN